VTQPDGEIPDSAIESLAAFAAKTQEEWEDELTLKVRDPFEKFTDFFAAPAKGFLSTLTGINFNQTPGEVWADIASAVQFTVLSGVQNFLDALGSAFGGASSGNTAASVNAKAVEIAEAALNAEAAAISLQTQQAGGGSSNGFDRSG
jgi:hypothetical protein